MIHEKVRSTTHLFLLFFILIREGSFRFFLRTITKHSLSLTKKLISYPAYKNFNLLIANNLFEGKYLSKVLDIEIELNDPLIEFQISPIILVTNQSKLKKLGLTGVYPLKKLVLPLSYLLSKNKNYFKQNNTKNTFEVEIPGF